MIWLVGNKGMLGSDVETYLKENKYNYAVSDKEVDITNLNTVRNFGLRIFKEDLSSNWLINCAAYTAVDKAEDEPELAFAINAEGVENLAKFSKEINAKIIHISTDYVFNGESEKAIKEESKPDPKSVYGKSKLRGEELLQNVWNKHFIIRTAWLYGKNGHNFVYTMIKLMEKNSVVKVVNDQYGSPTWSKDLADLIVRIIEINSNNFGIYHYSGESVTTWYGFAEKIYEYARDKGLITSICEVKPCNSDEFPTKAARPHYSILDKSKVKNTFKVDVPPWDESLDNFISSINREDMV